MRHIPNDIREMLETQASLVNSKEFIAADPVQFPRRFRRLQDIEIVALLASMIAWGNRTMICRDAERMLDIMDHDPYAFVMDGAYEAIDPTRNLHRTFFGRHMRYVLRGLHRIYRRYDSLDAMVGALGIGQSEAPAWELAASLNREWSAANSERLSADEDFRGEWQQCEAESARCMPTNLESSALKKLNMALRWLVRDDGIVDLGVWKSIPKSKLYIPLDVHVGNVSREIGLLERKSNDRRAVEELTEVCLELDPEDPARFDYALFGIGIASKNS